MTPKLYRHGEYISPMSKSWSGKEGALGKSTPEDRPERDVEGTLQRFDKKSSADYRTFAFGLIRTTYDNAIEYTRTRGDQRGMLFALGIIFCILLVSGGVFGGFWPEKFDYNDVFGTFLGAFVASSSIIFGISFAIFCVCQELFGFNESPLIFDRRHRKVYHAFAEQLPGLRKYLVAGPIAVAEYDWDLVDAEHNAEIVASGNSVFRRSKLIFFVRRSADDPTIIGRFEVATSMDHTDRSVSAVWEHIRRFMEEEGSHLPPGEEKVLVSKPPSNFGQAIKNVIAGEHLSFGQWLRKFPLYALIYLALFPLFGPMFLFAGIGNWLAHKTHKTFRWPQEVLQAIGPPTEGESAGGNLEK